MGIGMAMGEDYVYDSEGHLLNATFAEYQAPQAADMPELNHCFEIPAPSQTIPGGQKGAGESGTGAGSRCHRQCGGPCDGRAVYRSADYGRQDAAGVAGESPHRPEIFPLSRMTCLISQDRAMWRTGRNLRARWSCSFDPVFVSAPRLAGYGGNGFGRRRVRCEDSCRGAKPVAGLEGAPGEAERAVSLASLGELRGTRLAADGGLEIGSATTYASLAKGVFPGWQKELAAVAGNLADRSVRNMGTIGGGVCQADPRYDMPVLLSAADACFTLVSTRGKRVLEPTLFSTRPAVRILRSMKF